MMHRLLSYKKKSDTVLPNFFPFSSFIFLPNVIQPFLFAHNKKKSIAIQKSY